MCARVCEVERENNLGEAQDRMGKVALFTSASYAEDRVPQRWCVVGEWRVRCTEVAH